MFEFLIGDCELKLGHRIFVIEEDNSIKSISQKSFGDFYLQQKPSLPQFAGRAIVVAIVMYKLENRKPKEIFRIDTLRVRVDQDGSYNQEDSERHSKLIVGRIDRFYGPETSASSGSVIDAKAKFESKQWDHLHPEIPGPAYQRILEALFR